MRYVIVTKKPKKFVVDTVLSVLPSDYHLDGKKLVPGNDEDVFTTYCPIHVRMYDNAVVFFPEGIMHKYLDIAIPKILQNYAFTVYPSLHSIPTPYSFKGTAIHLFIELSDEVLTELKRLEEIDESGNRYTVSVFKGRELVGCYKLTASQLDSFVKGVA